MQIQIQTQQQQPQPQLPHSFWPQGVRMLTYGCGNFRQQQQQQPTPWWQGLVLMRVTPLRAPQTLHQAMMSFLSDDNVDDNRVHHQDEEEEGESQLDIAHNNNLTHITLEALLMGHEEAVTSLCWCNHAKAVYNQRSFVGE